MDVRGMVAVVVTDAGAVVDLSARPRARRPATSGPVHTVHVPRAAIDAALSLAGGDPRRLRLDPATGAVLVGNAPR